MSVPTHPSGMRSIWTSRDTLWHETVFPLSFPASSGLKWAGKEVAQSWSPIIRNPQNIPDSQTLLDLGGRGKYNDCNQMRSKLRKVRRYLLYYPGRKLNPGTAHSSPCIESRYHLLHDPIRWDLSEGAHCWGKNGVWRARKNEKKIKYYLVVLDHQGPL